MARPRKEKCIGSLPSVTYFKPQGVPLRTISSVTITHEEYETIRLSDAEQLGQIEGAERMNIHQSTFQRTLARARRKIAQALVNGSAIRIENQD